MAVVGSLTAYVFYGHINLTAKVETVDVRTKQSEVEIDDLWGKYNHTLDKNFEFMEKYYQKELEKETRWTELYKEKYQELRDNK